MATNIFNFDGTLLTTVADGAIDTTHASIKLPGKGYQNYGEPVLESLLWVMQNFSGTTAPSFPQRGQLWYDTTAGSEILKVYTGTQWTIAGGVIASDVSPGSGASQGAFWYDTVNKQLKTWSGTTWDIVGPLGSKVNTDVIDPAKPANSVIEAMRVNAVEDGLPRQIWRISIGGTLFAVLSKDPAFTPQSSVLTTNGFTKIYPGINFSTKIADASVSGDPTIFKSTQNNIPSLDSTYDLGTASKKFRTIYGSTGRFLSGLGVGANYSTQYKLQVAGNSRFDSTVNLGPGTPTTVPLKFNAAPTVPAGTEQLGAVEFDGNNFYFTSLLGGIPTRRVPIFGTDISAGKVLYVSSLAGNDTNDGRTRNSPYKTIKKALSYLTETSPYREGYTIFVETGDYLEQNPMFVPQRTSIIGDNLRRVIVRPVHTQLDIFHVEQGTYVFGMTFKEHRAPAFCFSFPCSTARAIVQGGKVMEIKYMYSQTGYDSTNPPTVFIEPPAFNSGGTTAVAEADIVNNAIVDVIVTNAGTGYSLTPGETGATIDPATTGGGQGAVFTVRTNDAGQVTGVDIVDPGYDYGDEVVINISGQGQGATAKVVKGSGVIRRFIITTAGTGYDAARPPQISIKGTNPPFIASSPYVQNCSSITGPFDIDGRLITKAPGPGNWTSATDPGAPYNVLDPNGAGAGLRIDGELLSDTTVVRSFVADAFTQFNQGGIGHLIINKGYTQFVSCFTTFSSVGYWARSGGFANISNSVIDFGDYGLRAEGYYPVPYTTGQMHETYYSTIAGVTITDRGYGYSPGTIGVTFTGGIDPAAPNPRAATGVAYIENGQVASVIITDPGSGYTGSTTEPVLAVFGDPPGGDPNARTAKGTAVLQPPANFRVDNVSRKPQFGSGVLYNRAFYIIRQVTAVDGNPTSWTIQTVPPIYSANQGANVYFHDVSNISTGGLALEYVGSGTTYNALPVYGGNPILENQVQDGETNPSYYPGRVYYVTIDNTGNFKVGDYFAVNFIDGTVKLNANAFDLSNLISIGPFRRNGVSVGTYADEISYDPTLTHVVNATTLDKHTLPTQAAVRGYFQQFTTNVYPSTSNVQSVGSESKRLANVVARTGYFSTVGIGTFNPAVVLEVVGNTTFGAPLGKSEVRLHAACDEYPEYQVYSYGDSSDRYFGGFATYASRGDRNTKFGTENGDIVGWLWGNGWNQTTASYEGVAEIDIVQSGDATSTGNPGSIIFKTSNGTQFNEQMIITSSGNIGIATTTPNTKLHIEGDVTVKNGEIRGFLSSSADAQFRAVSGNYGVMLLNDGANFRFLQTASTSTPESDTYNAYRPFGWSLTTGAVSIDASNHGTTFGGPVTATSGTVTLGTVSTGALTTTGITLNGSLNATGDLNAANLKATARIMGQNIVSNTTISASGTISAATLTSSGAVNGVSGAFSGTVNATTFTATGITIGSTNITATGQIQAGTLKATGGATIDSGGLTVSAGGITVSAGGATITGAVGVTGGVTASGQVKGATLLSTGALTVQASGADITGNTIIRGQLDVTGDIIGFSTSDRRLKTNVESINNALAKVNALSGITFNWNDPSKDSTKREAGIIAQEVQTVLPETVVERDNGYLAVDYPKLVPLLIEAIKELTARLDKLEGK